VSKSQVDFSGSYFVRNLCNKRDFISFQAEQDLQVIYIKKKRRGKVFFVKLLMRSKVANLAVTQMKKQSDTRIWVQGLCTYVIT